MNYPKISVVTPVLNQAKFIRFTIESILNQNYPNLEYVIIDGGSNDGTLEIINEYRDRVSTIVSEKDKGMYYALDNGLKKTTGDIMSWLNADDFYHNRSLFIAAEIFEKFRDIEFLMGQPNTFDEQGRFIHVGKLVPWSRFDYYLNKSNWPIQQESVFWRRSLWERVGGNIDTSYRLAADCELWVRFMLKGNADLHQVNALLGAFRFRPGQLSSNKEGYLNEVQNIYKNIAISEGDEKILKQIKQIENSELKIPILRTLLRSSQKHDLLFQRPSPITYDFKKMEFSRK